MTLLCCALVLVPPAWGQGQTRIPDYQTGRYLFWSKVYPKGGKTLYCNQAFGSRKGRGVNVEHVFPMAWVTNSLGCGRRKDCRDNSAAFNHIEADLHNMYPSRTDINDERGSHGFGMVKGEQRRYGKCDFELNPRARLVEPRDAVRGEIARAMFYMADTYELELFAKQVRTLRRWHGQDPVSDEERRRNDVIEQVQGNRNKYIDHPQLVDSDFR